VDLILRHPRWFWLSFAAVLALMLAFQPVTNVILDVVGTVILYVVVLGGIFLAGRALVRFQRKHRRGVPAR
jgi:uncharacterized membrane protein YidH (DUF202 family)